METYSELIRRLSGSLEYHSHGAMRSYVRDLMHAMDRRGMRNADLAAAIGSSPAYVTKILRGDINFTLATMTKLAMAVGGRLDVRIVARPHAQQARQRAPSRQPTASS